jgi:exonuclease SbcC
MRPLELTLEGFKSYREPETFDFDGRSLFGIVGPTGAGKSSILDAIVFALYGKTPRVQRDTKKLIGAGSADARVQLVFEADGRAWEVTRVLRRKGAAQVVLRSVGGGAEAHGEREANRRVEELLGLDFDAFRSSVVLAQGEFDRFLGATGGDRSKILKGIFRLERVDAVRESAKSRSAEIAGKLSQLNAELESLPADPEALERLKVEAEAASARVGEVREAMAEAVKAEAERVRAEESIAEIDRRMREAAATAAKIPEAAVLEELASAEDEARGRVEEALKKSDTATKHLAECQTQAAAAEKEAGGEELMKKARDLLRDHHRLAGEVASLTGQEPGLAEAEKVAESDVAQKTKTFDSAQTAFAGLQSELISLNQRHAAHLLRKDLVAGEPCPVCEQKVNSPPAAGQAPALKRVEDALAKESAKLESARSALEKSRTALALTGAQLKSLAEGIADKKADLEAASKDLTALLGKTTDPAAELQRRASKVRNSADALEKARAGLAACESEVKSARKRFDDLAQARRKYSAALIGVCAGLGIDPPDVDGGAFELLEASKRAADASSALRKTAAAEKAVLTQSAESAGKSLAAFRARFDLPAQAPIAQALEESAARAAAVQNQIANVEKALVRAAEIREETEKLRARRDLFARLAADLTDNKFIEYLLEGERRLLSQLGSESLYELTGSYRFRGRGPADDGGEFNIVDEQGEIRTPDTLSGGETFLASLALALALAEAVSRQGGRLECFFLDEGFGYLDRESRERALEGIAKLAVPGRAIGLISHVVEIHAWLDDLIVLDKAPDGATVVIQTEGPIGYAASAI